MNNAFRNILVMALILWCAAFSAAALEAGAAKVDITAPIGTPLNGYGARMGRSSTGIHDPIWSRALYLNDGQTSLFLVSVDLVAVNPELRQRVAELAAEMAPSENIILTATHTHNGQGAMTRSIPVRFVSGRFIPEVLEATASGIVASMEHAYDKRRRAALGYAVGAQQGLSSNRRYAGGPTEELMGVILVEDADGSPISVVTQFTAHPTSIGDPDTYSFSSDYPGFYYQEMETLLGEDCVPIFLNGALGNQTIGNPDNKSGWERTESVGRRVARRTHEIAQTISFSDVSLSLSHKYARLPLTLGAMLQPEHVLLHSLEINDLLLSFFPGEPCVELGLRLRERAVVRGYGAHFSVGLSNDYIMYFVPRHLYADATYESAMTFFGPGIEDWFYEQFESLMTRPAVHAEEEETALPPEPVMETVDGGTIITLAGPPRLIGNARGDAFVVGIQDSFQERVIEPVEQGLWIPDSGMWAYMPGFVDASALALPFLGMGSRNLLKGISLDLMREMEGMAEGARLPFDGLWLLQNAPLYSSLKDKAPLYAAPICTMFALTGPRAGSPDLIVGRNLDWGLDEQNVITRVKPDAGHAFVQVGFAWSAGLYTGMNDGGLVLSVERLQPETQALPERGPVEFMLRDLIQRTDSFDEALEFLQGITYVESVHVLVAGYEKGEASAAIVELGPNPVVRRAEDGILLGVDPLNAAAPLTTRTRYAALRAYLEAQDAVDAEEIHQFMTGNGQPGEDNLEHFWNSHTRHSAILLPQAKEMRIALSTDSGRAGTPTVVTMPGEQP